MNLWWAGTVLSGAPAWDAEALRAAAQRLPVGTHWLWAGSAGETEALIESRQPLVGGAVLTRGTFGAGNSGHWTLLAHPDGLSGTFCVGPGDTWSVAVDATGRVTSQSVPLGSAGNCAVAPGRTPVGGGPQRQVGATELQGDEIWQVNLLLLYTAAAWEGAGGDAGLRAAVEQALAETNEALERSDARVQIQLAGLRKTAYREAADLVTDLRRLDAPADGYLDDARRLRDEVGADLVCLLVEKSDGQYAGVAYQTADPDGTWSVVLRPALVGTYVLAHELAHNFGCAHDRPNAGFPGAFPYSYGHTFAVGRSLAGTVMAYPGARIPHFSNPEVPFLGVPTGLRDSADNARTLRERAALVSGYRGATAFVRPPQLAVTSPRPGDRFPVAQAIPLTVSAVSGTAPVARIEVRDRFGGEDQKLGEIQGAGGTLTVSGLAVGRHPLWVRAMDANGVSRTAEVEITVFLPNDAFAGSLQLTGTQLSLSVHTRGATVEPGEPTIGWPSVWYHWQAPGDGTLRFSRPPRENWSPNVAVFAGSSVNGLVAQGGGPVVDPTISGPRPPFVEVAAGVTYRIQVAHPDFGPDSGPLELTWLPRAPNDTFDRRILLSEASGEIRGHTFGATRETGEPDFSEATLGGSLWWEWQAPADGRLRLELESDGELIIGVATGAALRDLSGLGLAIQPAAGTSTTRDFIVRRGSSYKIWVATRSVPGAFRWRPVFTESPLNTTPENAIPLAAERLTVAGDTYAAVGGADDDLLNRWRQLWYRWTAPLTGLVHLAIDGTQTPVSLAITRIDGAAPAEITVTSGVFNAVAGGQYRILVTSHSQASGPFGFSLHSQRPPHDHFANAYPLGPIQRLTGSLAGATREPQESALNPSVWFRFTADRAGTCQFNLFALGLRLNAYRGDSLANLKPVPLIVSGSELLVATGAGETTYLAMIRTPGGLPDYEIAHRFLPAPPENDNFANRLPLSGSSVRFSGTTEGAGPEGGEGTASSIWWSWTAPSNCWVRIQREPPGFVAVYRGETIEALQPVGSSSEGSFVFSAFAGRVYQLTLADWQLPNQGPRSGQLNVIGALTANDFFENATEVRGPTFRLGGSFADDSLEFEEPFLPGTGYRQSRWWTWTAPASGHLAVEEVGHGSLGAAGVFQGPSVARLKPVADGDGRIRVKAGETYRLGIATGPGNNPKLEVWYDFSFTPSSPNDDFARRSRLQGDDLRFNARLQAGTREAGEPNHEGRVFGDSFWWTWTAPRSGTFVWSGLAENQKPLVAVYRGSSLSQLVRVAAGNGATAFTAEAGVEYQLLVEAGGGLTLHVYPLPQNDAFAAAAELFGPSVLVDGSLFGATVEPGEPSIYNSIEAGSRWWKWTAPAEALTQVTVRQRPDGPYAFGVFTGTTPESLVSVAGFGNPTFQAQAGVTYWIGVAGGLWQVGEYSLGIQQLDGRFNDAFADRIRLHGPRLWLVGSNHLATAEAAEPHPGNQPADRSLWWAWTAETNGWMQLQPAIGNQVHRLAVYAGNDLANLEPVPLKTSTLDWEVGFSVRAGETYSLAVDSNYGGEIGLVSWLGDFNAAPPNDDRAQAGELHGESIIWEEQTAGATTEPDEPAHAGLLAGHSVWRRWRAPSDGWFQLHTEAIGFQPVLAVYQAAEGNALQAIAANRQGNSLGSVCAFSATAGATYLIAVATALGEVGPTHLRLLPLLPATNSTPEFAVRLRGSRESTLASNVGAAPTAGSGTGLDGTRTLWWRWHAFAGGTAAVNTSGSILDTVVHVYSVSAGQRTLVAANDDTGSFAGPSTATWTANAGTAYEIAVGGFDNSVGAISVNLFGPEVPATELALTATVGINGIRLLAQGEPDSPFLLESSAQLGEWRTVSSGWFEGRPVELPEQATDTPGPRFFRIRRP